MFYLLKNSKSHIGAIAALSAFLLVSGCGGTPQQRAKNYYEQGAKYLEQKDYAKATIEFKNALQLNGSMIEAWRGLVQVEEHNQNLREIVPMLRKIVELDAKDVDARLKLARMMLMSNNLDEATKLTNAALALDERSAEAMVLKSAILLKQNEPAAAISEAEKALEIEPGNAGALIVLAAEKTARGDNQGALEILNRASSAGENFGVQFFKMQLFEKMGDLKQLESMIQKLVQLYPKDPAFRRQLVRLYVNQNRTDDAEKELRAIAAINPANIEAVLEIVRFLNSTRGAEAAKQELLNHIKSDATAFPYQIALAEFEAAQRNTDESVRLLESLIKNEKSAENGLIAQAKLAELYYGIKKPEAAETIIADMLRKDGRNINGLKLRAMIRMDRAQLDPAINDLRQALNDQPRATDLMILLALAYERNGSIDLAEKQYAEATRASNFNPVVGLNYVGFLQRRGGNARAEDILTELAARWPTNVQVLSTLASVKLARRDYGGAEEVATVLRKLGTGPQGVADQILGESLIGRNKLDQSIEVLQTAYEQAPGAVQPIASLVRALVRAQQVDRALALVNEALKKNPDSANLLVLLGSTYLVNNAPQEAQKAFQAAIEKQPKNVVGYQAMSNLLFQQKKTDQAVEVLQVGLKELPGNYTLRLILAGGFELQRNFEAAIAEYEALLKEQPGSMVVVNNLASLLTDQRTDKASADRAYSLISSLQKAQVPYFKDTIGWVYYRRGEFKAAVSQLEQASAELPNVALVRYHLGASYLAVGENEKAAAELNQALKLGANDNNLQETVRNVMKRAGIH